MDSLIGIAFFVASGAAWGLVWIGLLAVLKNDLSSPSALRLVAFIFAVLGSILAVYLSWNQYTDTSTVKFTGPLIIRLLPLILLYKGFRKSKLITGLIGICYVLLPYYHQIASNFS